MHCIVTISLHDRKAISARCAFLVTIGIVLQRFTDPPRLGLGTGTIEHLIPRSGVISTVFTRCDIRGNTHVKNFGNPSAVIAVFPEVLRPAIFVRSNFPATAGVTRCFGRVRIIAKQERSTGWPANGCLTIRS